MSAFRNEYLFSSHYLKHRLPESPEWREDIRRAFDKVRELREKLEKYGPGNLSEAQLEDRWIRPVVKEVLSWEFIPQGETRIQGARKLPDLALFPDEEHSIRFVSEQRPESAYRHALAILEAKAWGVDLDMGRRRKDTGETEGAPHFQLVGYLTWLPVRVGILTNGKKWRLYVRGENVGPRTFYEVDIDEALRDEENFRYFYFFFRRDAFLTLAGRPPFVDRVLSESRNFARALEDDLRKVIYEDWIEMAGKAIHEATNGELDPDVVFGTTLLLLFRLLFIAYAEARQILPAREGSPYYPYSLHAMVRDITRPGYRPSSRSTQLWGKLHDLFGIVNTGDESLEVPAYNGGLFSDVARDEDGFARERSVISRIKLTDTVTTDLLKLLFTRKGPHRAEMVDFSTLGTRTGPCLIRSVFFFGDPE